VAQYLRVSGSSYYRLSAQIYPPDGDGNYIVGLTLDRVISGSATTLAWIEQTCLGVNGYCLLKTSIIGNAITVQWQSVTVLTATDSNLTSGSLGAGTSGSPSTYTSGLGSTTLAYVDTTPPNVPSGLSAAPYATRIVVSWPYVSDNVATTGYKVYRSSAVDGTYTLQATLFYPSTSCPAAPATSCSWTDALVGPVETWHYKVSAFDAVLNNSALSAPLTVTSAPLTYYAPDSYSPVAFTESWGAQPEAISMLTGALGRASRC
jgi:hypothetical protein